MAKRSQYRMKYTEEWETDENLKDWIQPVDGDDRKAKCRFCEVLLPAHHVGLCGHALEKKHMKKMSEYTASLELDSLVNNLESGSNDCSFQSQTDELLEDCHTTTATESQSSRQRNELGAPKQRHQKSKVHMKNTAERDKDKKAGIKYQKRWHKNPRLAGWLAPVDGESTKAKCLYCEVELRAHSNDLGRHTRTKKHIFKSKLWAEKNADAKAAMAAFGMFEAKNADGVKSTSVVLSSESNREDRKRKSKIKNQEKVHVQQSPQSDSTDNETDLLFLECEAVDDTKDSVLLKSSLKQRSSTKKLTTSIAQNRVSVSRLLEDVTASEETSIPNHPLVLPSGSNADQLSSATAASLFKVTIKQRSTTKKLMTSIAQTRGEGMMASEETSIPNHPLILPSGSNADQLSSATAASCETDDPYAVADAIAMSIVAATADTAVKATTSMTDSAAEAVVDGYDLQKPGGDIKKLKSIVSSAGGGGGGGVEFLPSEAKLLKCLPESLQPAAKQRKLVKTRKTKKKIRIQHVQMDVFDDEDLLFMDSDFEQPSNSRQKSASHSNIDWSRYKKMYRKEWEMDPVLGDWVAPVDGDRLKAACKLCGCILRAHYTDLRHHRKTKKHTRNAHPHHNEASKPMRQLKSHQKR